MKTYNLGEVLGKFAQHQADEVLMHCDVDVMYAPSECHGLVGESMDRQLAVLETQVGMTFNEAVEKGEERTSPNTMKKYYEECVERILHRDNPFT